MSRLASSAAERASEVDIETIGREDGGGTGRRKGGARLQAGEGHTPRGAIDALARSEARSGRVARRLCAASLLARRSSPLGRIAASALSAPRMHSRMLASHHRASSAVRSRTVGRCVPTSPIAQSSHTKHTQSSRQYIDLMMMICVLFCGTLNIGVSILSKIQRPTKMIFG
jgi:hypothetical protein